MIKSLVGTEAMHNFRKMESLGGLLRDSYEKFHQATHHFDGLGKI